MLVERSGKQDRSSRSLQHPTAPSALRMWHDVASEGLGRRAIFFLPGEQSPDLPAAKPRTKDLVNRLAPRAGSLVRVVKVCSGTSEIRAAHLWRAQVHSFDRQAKINL